MTDNQNVFDLVVKGGTLVSGGLVQSADLAVTAGRVAAIGHNLIGREVVRADGLLVIPGGVDPHVHLSMPAGTLTTSEDWRSGTSAAACGGTTTVIDFVEPKPGQRLADGLAERKAEAQGQAVVDYALRMTLSDPSPSVFEQTAELAALGVASFKLYTTYAGMALSDDGMLAALQAVARCGGLAMVHAENDAILRSALGALRAAGRTAPQEYPLSRPAIAEVEAIQRVILLARFAAVPLYLAHISTERGAAAVERARRHGQVVYGETCPQYLLLDEGCYNQPDPLVSLRYQCAPPLRKPADGAALWEQLAHGGLQSIGSDHCAFNITGQKERGAADFTQAPGGLPGIETRLALLYSEGVRKGRLSLTQWVDCCCTAPAKIFGLFPRKGSLAIGADADFVLFDPALKAVIHRGEGSEAGYLHERVDHSPYEGFELGGWPVATYLGGRLIAQHGQICSPAPAGSFLHCLKHEIL